jgi:hypothetical protein
LHTVLERHCFPNEQVNGGAERPVNGAVFGHGIYCSPTVETASLYAAKGPLVTEDGDSYLVVFLCRVRPGAFKKANSTGGPIWLVTNSADIKPIAVLLGTA